MKILITGDFFITDSVNDLNLVDSEVKELFKKADYKIINLEGPITENNNRNKIIKTGPNLRGSEKKIIPVLKELSCDMVTLASNHIMDYGEKGLFDTLEVLERNGLRSVGVGESNSEANRFISIYKDNTKVAILNFCENEWSTTKDASPGANPLDIVGNSNKIKEAKKEHDKVICIIHGGHQLYNFPTPRMQKLYRFFVDQGADAIICHHSHCISGFEIYNEAPIYYGLGNFLFTLPYTYEGFHEGIVAELIIEKESPIKIRPKFVQQDKRSNFLVFTKGNDLLEVKDRFAYFNDIINDENQLMEHWNKLINVNSNEYLRRLSANSFFTNKFVSILLNRFNIKLLSRDSAKILLNLMRCESHAELTITALENYIKRIDAK